MHRFLDFSAPAVIIEKLSKTWSWLESEKEDSVPLLVVLGSNGSGKSALLGNFLLHSVPSARVFTHFTGVPPDGSSEATLLRRLIAFADPGHSTLGQESPQELQAAWTSECLPELGKSEHVCIIVLDGLDQVLC